MNEPRPGPTPLPTEFQPTPDTRDDGVNRTAHQPTPATRPAPAGRASYSFLGPPDRPSDLGKLGPYRVIWLLGEGGMGFVFEGEDEQLRRPVALKVMRPEIAAGPAAKERFLREGRAAAAVKNDHIITIYQVGEANGVPFLAMELLEGCTLDEWLRRQPGPVAPKAVAKVARNVLRGLAAAHAKGLVHRDIKPSNLWVEKGTSRVKLLDFGLTRLQDDQDRLTRQGQLVGTPAYMAPEQADGREVDARADLFSVGVVLHRMLAGKSPFERDTVMATLSALATVTPAPAASIAPGLPGHLAGLIDRLLARDPAARPADAGAALAEWQAAEKHGPAPATGSHGPTASGPNLPYAVPVEPPARPPEAGPMYRGGQPPEFPATVGGRPSDSGLDLDADDVLPDDREAENLLDGVHDYVKRDTVSDRQIRRDRRANSSRSRDRHRERDDERPNGPERRSYRERNWRDDAPEDGPPPLPKRKRRGFPLLLVIGLVLFIPGALVLLLLAASVLFKL